MPRLVTTSGWGGQEIRRFNDSGIQAQIDRALRDLEAGKFPEHPKGRRGAVIGYYNHKSRTVSGAVVAKLGRNWSVVGSVRHRIGAGLKDIEADGAVRFSW